LVSHCKFFLICWIADKLARQELEKRNKYILNIIVYIAVAAFFFFIGYCWSEVPLESEEPLDYEIDIRQ
jgi:hypothetical protein